MRGLLASPLGFVIGLALGALGGGGSIVAVPALVYAAGQEPAAATTTSLMIVGLASLVGVSGHARAGRVRFRAGIVVGLTGIGGSLAGSALNRHIDGDLLLLAFSGLVLVAAWRMVTGCPSCTRVGEAIAVQAPASSAAGTSNGGTDLRTPAGTAPAATVVGSVGIVAAGTAPARTAPAGRAIDAGAVVRIVAVGTAVGFLTGLFGVGGGFVIVPALTLVLGFNMPQAVGTSLLVIVINSATALVVRLGTTGVEWSVALPFTIAAMGGVLAGNRAASRVPVASLVNAFAGVLVALSAYIAITSVMHLT